MNALKINIISLLIMNPVLLIAQNLNCSTPWGIEILHDQAVFAYKSEIAENEKGCIAIEEQRICNNGILSGSFEYEFCQDYKSCEISGMIVDHGDSIELYREAITNEYPTCMKKERVCNDGVLEGDENYEQYTCTTKQGRLKKIEKAYAQLYQAAKKTGDYSSLKASVFTDYKRLLKSQVIEKKTK